jgi:hypothetical protein
VPVLGSLVFGLTAAIARERSESLAASIVLHWVCVTLMLLAHAQSL